MKQKKKILIVMHSLITGGIEKSLFNLLKQLDYEQLNVHLMCYHLEGNLKNDFLQEVRLGLDITEIPNSHHFSTNLFCWLHIRLFCLLHKETLLSSFFKKRYLKLTAITNFQYEFDLAISYHSVYAHLNLMVAEAIQAKKKILWHHLDITKPLYDSQPYLPAFDKIFTVSQAASDVITHEFPQLAKKIDVFYNLFDTNRIIEMSKEKLNDIRFTGNLKIVTVGRLSVQKGYDLAIKTAYLLKSQGIQFKWFAIGEGEKRKELEHQIKKARLVNEFILLGNQSNPYPYIKNADIYVQPSYQEGYCITVAEARLLKCPIVASDLASIKEQFKGDGIDVIFAAFKPEDFAEKIRYLINNPIIQRKLIANLSEDFDYSGELNKLYSLLDT